MNQNDKYRSIDINKKKEELTVAADERDAYKIAEILKLPIPSVHSISRKKPSNGNNNNNNNNTKTISLQAGGLDWSKVLTSWYETAKACEDGDFIKCYQHQSILHSNFHSVFSSSKGNWLVPALHTICKNSHKIALLADKQQDGGSDDNTKLQSAVTLLQESFSKTINDRKDFSPSSNDVEVIYDEEGSKKAGVLQVVNELFAMYFFLNTLRLCKNLVRPIEVRKLHMFGNLGPRVTYRYYVGRLFLFEDQYAAAEEHLDYAFQNCPKYAKKNKTLILRYLVPVKLVRGRLPSPKLLEEYQLKEFLPIVQGMKQGDLRTFHDGLVQYQDLFIRRGTYLLLEKCKTVCYRNLFKRIHHLLESHQIKLKDIATALKWLGLPIDLDEVECILANLIFRGYIRGYLSHAKRVLVLSKRDPFPVTAIGPSATSSSTPATTSSSATRPTSSRGGGADIAMDL